MPTSRFVRHVRAGSTCRRAAMTDGSGGNVPGAAGLINVLDLH
ncbi:hypothetical protein BZL29_1600 [Mycobacterium kansasii]|uniref:Uncharacterized protein n=1 Tax=Mycobacterium kansasii TaxID=1768 RepID=A0A1V3XYQ1_MYCKA|nr:hypothetical protein BZL29_1600 [Mycobacterium kansasii]